jgi:hypothetical protein
MDGRRRRKKNLLANKNRKARSFLERDKGTSNKTLSKARVGNGQARSYCELSGGKIRSHYARVDRGDERGRNKDNRANHWRGEETIEQDGNVEVNREWKELDNHNGVEEKRKS